MGPRTITAKRAGKSRDRTGEAASARDRLARNVADVTAARVDGSLGDDIIKLAQVLFMCALPHSRTTAPRVTRRVKLSDGTHLTVTFSTMRDDVSLPFGGDRKLLAWIFDRAIRTNSGFVPWSAASEYQRELGLSEGGKSNRNLQARFARIAGLGLVVVRERNGVEVTRGYKVLADTRLPGSITGRTIDANQRTLPGFGEGFGVKLTDELFDDIGRYNSVLPRLIWQKITGPSQVQDIALWLFVRCYAAASETVIPWAAFQEQFGVEDSNPRRIKANARLAVKLLGTIWPEASIEEDPNGIRVAKATAPLLPDDPSKGRLRKL